MHRILQPVGANTLYLLAVNFINALTGFVLAAVLAHTLGDGGFGQFTFVFTWILTLLTFLEFGLSTVLVRDLAHTAAASPRYLANSVAAKWLLALPVSATLIFFAGAITPFPGRQTALALQWGGLFLLAGLAYSSYTAVFKARQTMKLILLTTLVGQLSGLAGVMALLAARFSLAAVIIWLAASQWLQLLAAHWLLARQPGPRPILGGISKSSMWRLIRLAWPFALAGLLAALQLRASTLLLAYLAGDQPLGWYSAAGRIAEAVRQFPGAFFVAVLPAMAALPAGSSLSRSLKFSQLGLMAFSLAAAVAIFALAEPLIRLIYGPAFGPAVAMLRLLALGLIPALQNSLLIVFLYSRGDERFVNRLIAAGIVINLGLCVGLIPQWGGLGAALAMLAADSLLYLPYRWRAARYG